MPRKKIEHVTTDGQRWLTNTLSTSDGLTCSAALFGLIGAMGSGGASLGGPSAEKLELGLALPMLAAEIRDPRMLDVVRTLCGGLCKQTGATIDQVDFDGEFSGNYGVLLEVVAWLLEANFKSFLDGRAALGNIMRQLQPGRSKGRPTSGASTSPSGAPSSQGNAA